MNNAAPETIDDYIAGFPADVQRLLKKVRQTIRKAAPDAEEAIKYGMPTFVLGKNLIHFAGCKNHIGLYPTPSGITAFMEELSSYPNAKGSVQFPFDRPIPYDLIRRITEFRVKETREKAGLRTLTKRREREGAKIAKGTRRIR